MSHVVVQHQTAIWAELKEWHDKEKTHNEQARACWPEIASRMVRLRKDYPSDPLFGAALVEHGIEYNRDDRAAFIWMGSLKPTVLEDAMGRCERRSPKHFRREVESWGDSYFNPLSPRGEREEPSTSQPAIETSVPTESQESEPDEIPDQHEVQRVVVSLTRSERLSPLSKKLSAEAARAVIGHYTHTNTRTMLGDLPKPTLSAIAALVISGRLGNENPRNMTKFSPAVLVPELPKEWTRLRTMDAGNAKKRHVIDAIVADADKYIAMRDAGCKTKAQCDYWWGEHVTQRKTVPTATLPGPSTSVADSGERIVFHGEQIWPRSPGLPQEEQCTRSIVLGMYHLWMLLDRELAVGDTNSVNRAHVGLNVAKWLDASGARAMGTIIRQIATAQKQDPDNTKETSNMSYVQGDTL